MYFVYIYNSLVGLLDDPSSRLKQYFATETLTHIDSDQSPRLIPTWQCLYLWKIVTELAWFSWKRK